MEIESTSDRYTLVALFNTFASIREFADLLNINRLDTSHDPHDVIDLASSKTNKTWSSADDLWFQMSIPTIAAVVQSVSADSFAYTFSHDENAAATVLCAG